MPTLVFCFLTQWLGLYVASALAVTLQQSVLHPSNNFRVFRSATINLLAGRDLYAAHPEQHFDFYKYSPTFALLFAPLAYLPFAVAFLCWTLLNALLLWYALERLLPQRQATLAIGLLYLEVLFAMQYGQSNALVAALMVLAFVALQRGRQLEAATEVALGASIKLFPLALFSGLTISNGTGPAATTPNLLKCTESRAVSLLV